MVVSIDETDDDETNDQYPTWSPDGNHILYVSNNNTGGSAKGRPELQSALDYVRDDDVFVVTKLDRLARSVVDLAGIVQRLESKKVDLVVLDQGIDTTTMYGRLQFNILAAIV